jgi:hypothetical protein
MGFPPCLTGDFIFAAFHLIGEIFKINLAKLNRDEYIQMVGSFNRTQEKRQKEKSKQKEEISFDNLPRTN